MFHELKGALLEKGACDGRLSGGLMICPNHLSNDVVDVPGMGYICHVSHHEGHL